MRCKPVRVGSELETLRTLRQRALDEAEGRLGRAQQLTALRVEEHESALQHLLDAQQAVALRVQAQRQRLGAGFRGGDWVTEQSYQTRLSARVDEQQRQVRVAATGVDDAEAAEQVARQAVLEARRQVQVLEKHEERRDQKQRRLDQRRADKESDDLVNARHGRS